MGGGGGGGCLHIHCTCTCMCGCECELVNMQCTHTHAHAHTHQILLPELAILRVAAFDDDKELVGQRCLPVNHIRPGFRYIPLRDKHNQPLPLAMLFVNIKVEDCVPNEFEGTYIHVCVHVCVCVCACARARACVCVYNIKVEDWVPNEFEGTYIAPNFGGAQFSPIV